MHVDIQMRSKYGLQNYLLIWNYDPHLYKNYWIGLAHCDPHAVCCSVCRGCWDKRPMFWNCTRCPKLSPLSGEVVIQCGTIWSPKGFDISRLCHSNLSRSEDHSFLESSAKKGSPAVNLLLLLCSTIWNYILIFRLDTIWQEKNLLIFEKHLPNYEIICTMFLDQNYIWPNIYIYKFAVTSNSSLN